MVGLDDILAELLDGGHRHRHGADRHHEPCYDEPGYGPDRADSAERRCAACTLPVPHGASFCVACGASQDPAATGWSCFLCGHALPPHARFCPGCGNAVE